MTAVQRIFTIPKKIGSALDESIPKQKRSKFVSKAIIEALQKENNQELIKAIDGIEMIEPKGQSVVEMIQELRMQESDKLVNT